MIPTHQNKRMKHILSLFAFVCLFAFGTSSVATPQTDSSPATQSTALSVEVLTKKIQALEAENEALKRENEELRNFFSVKAKGANAVPSSQPAVQSRSTTSAVTKAAPKTAEYWITTSSSKRHNKNCRYFMNSRGRKGGHNEGIACKICGG